VDLVLIRHAEAAPLGDTVATDGDRPLTARGHAQAKALGRLFQRRQVRLDRIFTSPLLRARQTAEALRTELGPEAPAVTVNEELGPGRKRRKLARSLRELGGSCVGIVGHEPDLGVFAAWLIGSKKAQIKLAKGGAADVSFPDDLRKGAGVLVWLLTSDWIEEPPTQTGV
jgi:phosphohistidine phosphatase